MIAACAPVVSAVLQEATGAGLQGRLSTEAAARQAAEAALAQAEHAMSGVRSAGLVHAHASLSWLFGAVVVDATAGGGMRIVPCDV